MSAVGEVRTWLLEDYHIVVPDEWLEACIEWIHQENQGQKMSTVQLRQLVYEQWLLGDLKELGAACLPDGLVSAEKFMLNGYFTAQIISLKDVSQPHYAQLQKLKGMVNENTSVTATQPSQPSWEPKASRMLMMQLTDGTHDVQGMEYKQIKSLSTNTKPGTKILLKGPILSRLGVLMLSESNVSVLGGEVDVLVEENCQVRLMARALNLNEAEVVARPTQKPVINSTKSTSQSMSLSNDCIADSTRGQNHRPTNNNPKQQPYLKKDLNKDVVQRGSADRTAENHTVIQGTEFDDDFPSNDQLNDLEQWAEDDDLDIVMSQMDTQVSAPSVPPSMQPGSGSSRIQESVPSVRRRNVAHVTPSCSVGQGSPHDSEIQENSISTMNHSSVRPWNDAVRPSTSAHNDRKMGPWHVSTKTSKVVAFDGGDGTWNSEFDEDLDDFDFFETMPKVDFKKPLPKENIVKKVPVNQCMFSESAISSQSYGQTPIEEEESQSILGPPPGVTLPVVSLQQTTISTAAEASLEPSVLCQNFLQQHSSLRFTAGTLSTDSVPFIYLTQVMGMVPTRVKRTVMVKAYISTLTSKLEHNNGQKWTLQARINDGTASMEVDLGDELLTNLIGFSASDVITLRRQAGKDPSAREQVTNAIKKCQKALIELSSIMELEIGHDQRKPYVCTCLPITETTIAQLSQRLKSNIISR